MYKEKIGFPIEYECDGIIYDGLFLREPEIKELEKRLKEINKITDLKQQCKNQKEVIDKLKEWINIVQQNKDNKHLEPFISTDELDELLDILNEGKNE